MESNDNTIGRLIKEAFKFEYKTNGGRINAIAVLGVLALGGVCLIVSPIVEAIYIIATHNSYPMPGFTDVLFPFLGTCAFCFLYMVLLVDELTKVTKKKEVVKARVYVKKKSSNKHINNSH